LNYRRSMLDLADTASWASASVTCRDGMRFVALAIEIVRRLNKFNGQGLANTAGAFARVN